MLIVLILFILGLLIGSAVNSFLWRYQTKTSYAGRSMCPACKHKLAWYDNVPLISWLTLSGKCRYCKKSIAVQYPIVEMLTGFAFALVGLFSKDGIYVNHVADAMLRLGTTFAISYFLLGILRLLLLLLIVTCLLLIAIYDYKTKEIPNGFNLTFILLSATYLIVSQIPNFDIRYTIYYLLAALAAFLFFYSFVYFSHETWMGGGDAKMAFGMGLLLGPGATLLAIIVASISGSIYGISQILIQKSKIENSKLNKNFKLKISNSDHQVPFGPFLALGTYIAMIFGPQIIDWYVRMVLAI